MTNDVMPLPQAALWALQHFVNVDKANACIHVGPVRFSPITFRLAEALVQHYGEGEWGDYPVLVEVMAVRGSYAEDPGR